MSAPLFIPWIFRELVATAATKLGMPIYFDGGNYVKVAKDLTGKDQGMTDATRTKYPLVWLVMDFAERMGNTTEWYAELPELQLIIATGTQATYTLEEREAISFTPVLYPIYAAIIDTIRAPGSRFNNPYMVDHTKIDRPLWDGSDKNTGLYYFLNDRVDGLQIKFHNLKLKFPKC